MFLGSRLFKNQAKIIFRSNFVVRSKHSSEGFDLQTFGHTSSKNRFHQSPVQEYPATEQLPLPLNIEDLASSEKLNFSPQRSRDINGSFISSSTSPFKDNSDVKNSVDDRVECYDCSGTVNLSSTMQTNVPYPFVCKHKPIHLNMPGGQWGQKEKYVSEDLNNFHHSNFMRSVSRNEICGTNSTFSEHQRRKFCTGKDSIKIVETSVKDGKEESSQLTMKQKLKVCIKDYGAVILVFHIGMSLMSLGCCYLLISNGVDLTYVLKQFGADDGAFAAGAAANMVVAYAVHKSLAPVRIGITLASAPVIVKKLRKVGILKTPQPKM